MRSILIVLLLVVLAPMLALAANGDGGLRPSDGGLRPDTSGKSVGLPDALGGKDFITILKQVVNFLIAAAIPIAALMIIYGAYQIMFAGGDTEKVTTGKRTILYTVAALVIIVLAWSIIYVIKDILGVRIPN